MNILGMDLGTSNTYLYSCFFDDKAKNTGGMPAPLILKSLSDANGSIATVVLYEHDSPLAIGNVAESEFNAHPSLQGERFLASQFKPEIARKDSAAQRWMKDFLTLLRQAMPETLFAGQLKIFVGIPSLAREDFSLNLGDCFVAAGWPMPEFVRESDAAVVSCLQAGALHIRDMERKCLILDFGGGTCDYTAIEGLDVLQNGGDALYGGRLFDDLIYQIFLDSDREFCAGIKASPAAWFAHWVECRKQKEEFSDFVASELQKGDAGQTQSFTMRIGWVDGDGSAREAYATLDRHSFMRQAENYTPTPELSRMLSQYENMGGLGQNARDLLDARQVSLITWLRQLLEKVEKRNAVRKIILTGGSARWFFVRELCARLFQNAECVPSRRGFEDIAFGLALFPILLASREHVSRLLEKKLPQFTREAVRIARELIDRQTAEMTSLCSQRIVERDILPALEDAKGLTFGELARNFRDNIINDHMLMEIVRQKSLALNERIREELGAAFRCWLKENGVLLAPEVEFPGKAVSDDFFVRASESLKKMDLAALTRMALLAIIPIAAGGMAAHALAPLGEPISIAAGTGIFGAAAWVTAKSAPEFLEKRKVPSFLLKGYFREKIVEKNRKVIEAEMKSQFASAQEDISRDVEKMLSDSLKDMVGGLSILNQIQIRQIPY